MNHKRRRVDSKPEQVSQSNSKKCSKCQEISDLSRGYVSRKNKFFCHTCHSVWLRREKDLIEAGRRWRLPKPDFCSDCAKRGILWAVASPESDSSQTSGRCELCWNQRAYLATMASGEEKKRHSLLGPTGNFVKPHVRTFPMRDLAAVEYSVTEDLDLQRMRREAERLPREYRRFANMMVDSQAKRDNVAAKTHDMVADAAASLEGVKEHVATQICQEVRTTIDNALPPLIGVALYLRQSEGSG